MYSLNLRFCITSRSGLTVGHDIWDREAKHKNEKKRHNASDGWKSVTLGHKGPKKQKKLQHIRSGVTKSVRKYVTTLGLLCWTSFNEDYGCTMRPESIMKVIATANIIAELFFFFFFSSGKDIGQIVEGRDRHWVVYFIIIHYFYTTYQTNISRRKTTKI